jgi:glutamine synthetase
MGTYKGVTHYTHWFQPLQEQLLKTCAFETSHDGSDPVEKFGGAQLVQQEPDASVFQMEESEIHLTRGYTAWDPTSPAFILERLFAYLLFLFRTRVKL